MTGSSLQLYVDSIDRMASTVLKLSNVSVVRDKNTILDNVSWTVNDDERWIVLGRNGAGKTTLLQLAAAEIHPTSGQVEILRQTMGRVDVFDLRPTIGFASTAMIKKVPKRETVLDTVLTAAYSVTGRWNEEYEDIDIKRAERLLREWQLEKFSGRRFGSLSDGEQKRVQIARSVMTDPELLLLDEPAASLDLGSREELVSLLGGFASSPSSPAIIMVTHHVEEIPAGFSHVLLLRDGQIVSAGPLKETLTAELLSDAFALPIELTETDGRYFARSR